MSNLQPNCCLEFDFRKVDQHAGGKWLIHDTMVNKFCSEPAPAGLVPAETKTPEGDRSARLIPLFPVTLWGDSGLTWDLSEYVQFTEDPALWWSVVHWSTWEPASAGHDLLVKETSFPEEDPDMEVWFIVDRFLEEPAPAGPTHMEDWFPWEAESELLSVVHQSPCELAPAVRSAVQRLREEPTPAAGQEADVLQLL